ncbi:MAG: hypothetical protein ACREXU_10265 [Gammaproteobacteria bacterium]
MQQVQSGIEVKGIGRGRHTVAIIDVDAESVVAKIEERKAQDRRERLSAAMASASPIKLDIGARKHLGHEWIACRPAPRELFDGVQRWADLSSEPLLDWFQRMPPDMRRFPPLQSVGGLWVHGGRRSTFLP